MPSLSDRLKSLGVKVGAQELVPQPPRHEFSIEKIVPGRLVDTIAGQAYLVEQVFTTDYQHGAYDLNLRASLDILARWAGVPDVAGMPPRAFAFLDTETTGLAGGSGTYAFLVGVGRYEDDGFHLVQFFMRDPTEESALLLALESYLAHCQVLVTFNGKAFDAPLLNARYIMQGWRSPLRDLAHIDLLHLARRLWRDRLPSRTLGNLEVQILDAHRTAEEVPGWMIPQMYFDYLRTGDARPMKNVLYHNLMDVVSMAALLSHTTSLLANPLEIPALDNSDKAALARLYEDLGNHDLAASLYRSALDQGLPEDLFWDTLQRLSFLHKRRNEYDQAIFLWEKAARHGFIYAHVELAKLYEHTLREIDQALFWTREALVIIESPTSSRLERQAWQAELIHRLERLQRKTSRNP